jgi:hypothetical protein
MAKKTKTKAKKSVNSKPPSKEESFLKTLIKYSMAGVTNKGDPIDVFFKQQVSRLEKQLKDLETKK